MKKILIAIALLFCLATSSGEATRIEHGLTVPTNLDSLGHRIDDLNTSLQNLEQSL